MDQSLTSIRSNSIARTMRRLALIALLCTLVLMLTAPRLVLAGAVVPDLGTAGSFGVLAASAVTNTGPTTVDGDVGVSPGTAVTGFPPGITNGTIHGGDAVALQAQSDATNAYNVAAAQTCDFNLTGQDLGGMTLIPGVYCFDTSAQLTGQLTLDGQGSSNSLFIFKIGSTLTTASNGSVLTINSAQPCFVFWQVGSSATIGTTTHFAGNILALTSITLNTGATTSTGLYALNGAITLDTNDIHACSFVGPTPTPTPVSAATGTVGATSTVAATATTAPSTATNTAVAVATNTPTDVPTNIPTQTPAPRATDVPTQTPGVIGTRTPANTATPNDTPVPVDTVVPNDTPTTIPVATDIVAPSATVIATNIAISTPSGTAFATAIETVTSTSSTATPTTAIALGTVTVSATVATTATPTTDIALGTSTPMATITVSGDTSITTTQTATTPTPKPFLPGTGGGSDGNTWTGPLALLLGVLLLVLGLNIRVLFRKVGIGLGRDQVS